MFHLPDGVQCTELRIRRTTRPVLATLLLLALLPLLTGFGGVVGACHATCEWMTGATSVACSVESATKPCCKDSAAVRRPAPATQDCPWLAKLRPEVPPAAKAPAPPLPLFVALPVLAATPVLSLSTQTLPHPTPRHPPPTPVSLSVRLNC